MISKDHLHVMYVPAVPDSKHEGYSYSRCADELTKRAKLKAFHQGLQKHLNEPKDVVRAVRKTKPK